MCGDLLYDKGGSNQGGKGASIVNTNGATSYYLGKKVKLSLYLSSDIQISNKWNKYLQMYMNQKGIENIFE